MNTAQPKKLIIMDILEILRKYTDENHRLSQKEIADLLLRDYGMSVNRKAVKRNIMDLIDFGYEIVFTETTRYTPNPKTGKQEENVIYSDFYLQRDFTDSELRLLIDGVLFNRHIPYRQRKSLVEKLEGLSNQYFKVRVSHVSTVPDNTLQNKQLFYTIEVLDEAITRNRQVSFLYQDFGLDKKTHPRTDSKGRPWRYVVNPYQMAAANSRYYLICNYDRYDDVGNFRLDRMEDIQILEAPRKPMNQVKGLEHGLNLPKHMAEHIYMFAGESNVVEFRFSRNITGEIFDWFGRDIEFSDIADTEATARVKVNLMAMRKWALQYALYTRILSPSSLAEQVKRDLEEARNNYESEGKSHE